MDGCCRFGLIDAGVMHPWFHMPGDLQTRRRLRYVTLVVQGAGGVDGLDVD